MQCLHTRVQPAHTASALLSRVARSQVSRSTLTALQLVALATHCAVQIGAQNGRRGSARRARVPRRRPLALSLARLQQRRRERRSHRRGQVIRCCRSRRLRRRVCAVVDVVVVGNDAGRRMSTVLAATALLLRPRPVLRLRLSRVLALPLLAIPLPRRLRLLARPPMRLSSPVCALLLALLCTARFLLIAMRWRLECVLALPLRCAVVVGCGVVCCVL